ncbi:Stonustoxin subunit alpha [Labeo rohita]|uniref:Stonustoxin subunit alpha n=1 Tax=Labeo rohita TaxID=84645 RepID=A0ABQ8L6F7_LABRO|nr:Stonustoxin subunit alpha [Labeo rohita]
MCCKTGTFPGTDPVGDTTTKTGTVPGNPGRLVTLLNVRYIEIHSPIVDHGGEFRITSGLHKYACDLTLDTNTANKQLKLSDENRKVTRVIEQQSYPDHPDRFDGFNYQVLSVESLTGRCYWETEWSGNNVRISVSYKEIPEERKEFTARHNNNYTDISAGSVSSKRVGVYVDVSGGTLSFYSVSDTHKLTRLHTFTHTFTQTLHAGFRLYPNCSVSLCFRKFNIRHTRQFPVSDHQDEDVSPRFTDVLNQQQ